MGSKKPGIQEIREAVSQSLQNDSATMPTNEQINTAINQGVKAVQEMVDGDPYGIYLRKPAEYVPHVLLSSHRPLIDDLVDYCAKWQKRLRLMDWKVYIRIARMRDMDAPNHAAEITIKWSEKTAYLRHLDPQDYVGCVADEPELNILHELCHILTRGICEDQHCDPDAEEIAVICLSEALYRTEYPDWQEKVETYREVKHD